MAENPGRRAARLIVEAALAGLPPRANLASSQPSGGEAPPGTPQAAPPGWEFQVGDEFDVGPYAEDHRVVVRIGSARGDPGEICTDHGWGTREAYQRLGRNFRRAVSEDELQAALAWLKGAP